LSEVEGWEALTSALRPIFHPPASIYDEMYLVQATPIQLLSSAQLTAFNLAALSLALTLLVMFMSDTPMISHGVSYDVPRVNHPHPLWHAQRGDALVVAVMRPGDVFFGNDKLAPDRLNGKLRERLASTRERRVYIRADARARWGRVADVIDQVRAAGIWDVALFADQPREAVSH
jgi:biopolymer transport protein TolR